MHNLEIIDGAAQMTYNGEVPWHGLGKRVPGDLTPAQMCEAAGLDWRVEKRKATFTLNGKSVHNDSGALVRVPNGRHVTTETELTKIPNLSKWHEWQNEQAFEFFNDFIAAGDMEMHTAGSLSDGKVIWALAKVKESFYVVKKKDEVESFLLFTNPHQFGRSIDVRFTPTRVVCNNTLTMALNETGTTKIASSHRRPFNAEEVKQKLGLAHYKLGDYKEKAQFLASRRYKNEDVVEYFKRVFPLGERDPNHSYKRPAKELHRGAQYSMAIVDTQPGAEIAPGTFWNLYNAASFYLCHLASKSATKRVESLWMGAAAKTNLEAMDVALEMANAA